MGGSIFKSQGIESSRIDSEKYVDLCYQIHGRLSHLFNDLHIIHPYFEKEDFGDIDTLIAAPKDTFTSWDKQIIQAFPDCKIARNSDEISILAEGKYQLDFRIIKQKYWETSVLFSDFDPLSNCLGRIARFLGLRFGYEGLSYPIYTENGCNKLEKVSICRDPRKIYEFFGLDYDRHQEGFQTKEEIFNFIISSRFYSIICFDPANWDHSTRTRNKKRKVFCEFIEWVNLHHNYEKFKFAAKDQKESYIPMISDFFNINLQEHIDEAREKYKKDVALAEKFNGNLVISWINKTGPELGKILGEFKNSIHLWANCESYKVFLETHSAAQIEEIFLTWYENCYKVKE